MDFKKGLYQLNENENFNYKLNRLINWDGGNLERVKACFQKIKTNDDWKRTVINLGNQEIKEDKREEAIAYYRMSEFFMFDQDFDKIRDYRLAKKMFYEEYEDYFRSGQVEKDSVTYGKYELPVMHTKVKGKAKGTILFHGGNDSYFEELFFSKFLEIALSKLPRGMSLGVQILLNLKMKCLFNWIAERKMKNDIFLQWVFNHGMYAYDAESPYEYFKKTWIL